MFAEMWPRKSFMLLVLVLSMAASRPAAALLQVQGGLEFREQVQKALDAIGSADPRCRQMLDELRNSSHKHWILPTGKLTSSNGAEDAAAARNGTGTGSTTKWNPDALYRYDSDVLRNAVAALKHELAHAKDADDGTWTDATDPTSGILEDEIEAVRAENRYRAAAGLPARTTYGTALLPGCVETTCSGSPCNLRFRSCFDSVDCVLTHQMANLDTSSNACYALDELGFSGSDLEDIDDDDDDHIAQNRKTAVATAALQDGRLCCGNDISGGASCITCNEMSCPAQFWVPRSSKAEIPVLSREGLIVLLLLLMGSGVFVLRRS